jgi:hypothetical protein
MVITPSVEPLDGLNGSNILSEDYSIGSYSSRVFVGVNSLGKYYL